jgi:type VI secretion system secreted protein VgrG
MSGAQAGSTNRGSQADYVLGTAEGWDAFGVVRWHGVEEISHPFRYDITLQRAAASGAVDLDKLLDAGATFRIATQQGWRTVQGVLAEAEEIERTDSIILYRVLLVPHFWRARYRRRCRVFVGWTLTDIISAVLENRSPVHPEGLGGLAALGNAQAPDAEPDFSSFTPPTGSYRWNVGHTSRIGDPTVRPNVAQYNESDFDFVARLLEDEGLSYYFEHGADQGVFTITDNPGLSPMFDAAPTYPLRRVSRSGSAANQEIVRALREARRMSSRSVMVRDWDYNRSGAPLEATANGAPSDMELSRHFEFPGGEELVGSEPGIHAASVRLERHDAERALRDGVGTVRTMQAGYRFTMHDADTLARDAKLLTVRVETYATELAPQGTLLDEEPFGFTPATGPLAAGYENRFVALPEGMMFRPAMRTPRPRIHGVQTAVVTAEEFQDGERPVINADKLGRVRLRFPWDQRPDTNDSTPTSDWIRVSQYWAGASYGALYTPRVGHEVLVAFMQGDPDRAVIVGRVYNVQHPPPCDASKEPTKSTVKSQSAQALAEVDGFNEIRFEDRAKQEEIFLHAQRDLNEVVIADHSTGVGGDQSNGVGGDQTNSVKGHRVHSVGDYETVTVGDDRTTILQANEHHSVSGERDTKIGANEELTVGGFRKSGIGANDDLNVGGWHNIKVAAGQTIVTGSVRDVTAGGNQTYKTTGNWVSEASSNHVFKSTNAYFYPAGDFQVDSTTAGFNQTASFYVKAGSASISMSSGIISIDNGAGASISLCGGLIGITAGACVVMQSAGLMALKAGMTNIDGGAVVNAKAGTIKLNG